MNWKNKKILVSTIIGVTFFLLLIIGTAYAYFSVNSRYDFSASASATTPAIGSVVLQGTNQTLSMDLTRSDMMSNNAGTYYASFNGKTKTPTEEVIGVASVDGAGTYTCNYTIKIDDNSNSIYDKFQNMTGKSEGQIVLTVNGLDYDFNTSNLFPKRISGTLSGISESTPQNITAGLKFVNSSTVDQSALADSNITLSFTTESFSCEADGGGYTIAYDLNGGTVGGGSDTVTLEMIDQAIKVSSSAPTAEELDKGWSVVMNTEEGIQTITSDMGEVSNQGQMTLLVLQGNPLVIILREDMTEEGMTIKKGTYFLSSEYVFISSFTVNGYAGYKGSDTVVLETIDGQILKVSDSVPTAEELDKGWSVVMNTEEGIQTITSDMGEVSNQGQMTLLVLQGNFLVIILREDMTEEETTMTKGTYFVGGVSSFTINGYTGFGDEFNPTTYTSNSEDITLMNPSKANATFLGWVGSNGNTPEKTVTIPKGSTGSKSYIAVWDNYLLADAVYSEDDNSLRFYYNKDDIVVGEKYNGLTVTKVYEDISLEGYEYQSEIPWWYDDTKENVTKVVFEDEDIPIIDFSHYFYDFTKLKIVENIPSSVKTIGASAFHQCSSLESITIPEGVTSIGDYAFSQCSSLTSITIPEGVTSIGTGAFQWCSSLTSITIPEGVTSIGSSAFYQCSSLESITIPEGVTSIGNYTFSGCSSLTSITLPSSLTSISVSSFPAPNDRYIPGADGNWYNQRTGQAYTASTLPTGVAATYVAVNPN